MSTNAVSFLNDKNTLHHAYLLVGNRVAAHEAVHHLLVRDLKIDIKNNPDIHRFDIATFSIDDARAIKANHFLKPVNDQAFFIISFDSITWEAQQSLLKVFEDPVAGNHFFVIAPRLQGFLPTLLSRFFVITLEPAAVKTAHVETFLASTPAVRLKLIAPMVEDKDKQAAILFLHEIQAVASELIKRGGAVHTQHAQALGESLQLLGFLQSRSPSVKMILEHVALTFPVISIS